MPSVVRFVDGVGLVREMELGAPFSGLVLSPNGESTVSPADKVGNEAAPAPLDGATEDFVDRWFGLVSCPQQLFDAAMAFSHRGVDSSPTTEGVERQLSHAAEAADTPFQSPFFSVCIRSEGDDPATVS